MKSKQDYIIENLNYFEQLISSNKNFSIVKIGDGEIDCMQNKPGGNIDYHPYSEELGNKLKNSFIELSNKRDIFICDWFYSNPPINLRDEGNLKFYNNFISNNKLNLNYVRPFELLMLGWDNLELPNLFNFYKVIKNSTRNKIYVGPKRISEIVNLLNINHFIEIPLINAFASHNVILNEIKKYIVDESIVMLSVGLQSPVLVNALLNFNQNITILDIGSGFDPLYYAQTRGCAQASIVEAKKYFENL
jgi:hypothetical protein